MGGGDNLKLEEKVIAVLGEWGYLQGWDFVDHHHENKGVTACLGEWGCFSVGMGFGGSPSPLKGQGNCSSGGMGLFSLGMGLSS